MAILDMGDKTDFSLPILKVICKSYLLISMLHWPKNIDPDHMRH